ncbi:MAG: zf-HC2 domain-containing protein [Phycisphaerales bacterium]|nr:zf-HC2 domain-containing protein [Phycisphaerales bacterium]
MDARRCSGFEADLSAWLDGELPPQREAELRAHLDDCHACRALAEDLRRTSRMLADLPVAAAPPGLLERVLREAGSAQPPRSHPAIRRTLWLRVLQVSASAAALLITAVAARTFWLQPVNAPITAPASPPAIGQTDPRRDALADSAGAAGGGILGAISGKPDVLEAGASVAGRRGSPGGMPTTGEFPAEYQPGTATDALAVRPPPAAPSAGDSGVAVGLAIPPADTGSRPSSNHDAAVETARGADAVDRHSYAWSSSTPPSGQAPIESTSGQGEPALADVALTVIAANQDEYARAASIVRQWETALSAADSDSVIVTARYMAVPMNVVTKEGVHREEDGGVAVAGQRIDRSTRASSVRAFMNDLQSAGLESVRVDISAELPVVAQVSEALHGNPTSADSLAARPDDRDSAAQAVGQSADSDAPDAARTDLEVTPPDFGGVVVGHGRTAPPPRDELPPPTSAAAATGSSAPPTKGPQGKSAGGPAAARERASGRGGLAQTDGPKAAPQPASAAPAASRIDKTAVAPAPQNDQDSPKADDDTATPTDPAAWKAVAERLRTAADIGARVADAASQSFRGLFGVSAVPVPRAPTAKAGDSDAATAADPILRLRVVLIPPPAGAPSDLPSTQPAPAPAPPVPGSP